MYFTGGAKMAGAAGMVAGTVEGMAGKGMTVGARDMRASMRMNEIQMAALDPEARIYSLLWSMFGE